MSINHHIPYISFNRLIQLLHMTLQTFKSYFNKERKRGEEEKYAVANTL